MARLSSVGSLANTLSSSSRRRLASFLPTPGTVAIIPASSAATTPASWAGVNVDSTESASLGPTPEMAHRRSNSERSSRVEKPKSVMESSRTMRRASSVTPGVPTSGSEPAVTAETPSS